MLSLEQKEQLLDYVELALALAGEECTQCRYPYSTDCILCSSCSVGTVISGLQKVYNTMIQIAIL